MIVLPEDQLLHAVPLAQLTILLEQVSRFDLTDERVASGAVEVIELAERLDDNKSLVGGSLLLAQHLIAKSEFARATDILEPLLKRPGGLSLEDRAQTLLLLTRSVTNQDEATKVLRYGSEALKYYQLNPDPELQLELHFCLGRACARSLALPEALEHQQAALDLAKAQGAKRAAIYSQIAWVHSLLGDIAKGIDYLETSLRLAQEEDDIAEQGSCFCNLSTMYCELAQYEKALEYSHQATAIFEAQGKFNQAMICSSNAGYINYQLGNLEAARAYYAKVLEQVRETPYPFVEGATLLNLGEAWLAEDSDRAEALMQRGFRVLHDAGILEGVPEAYKALAEHFERQGEFAKALGYHRSYTDVEIKKFKETSEKRAEALSIKFELERLQREQEIYQLKNVELARVVTKLEELSVKDGLTGLYNRRYLDRHLERVFKEAKSSNQGLGVLISDIDSFKQINDSFSHAIGDDVIRIVAEIFCNSVRNTDVVARYGGEEYVVIFQSMALNRLQHIAEKLRRKVADYAWAEVHPGLSVTVSIGLCADMSLGHHEKMLAAADRKLYEAKRAGRNQIR